MEPRPFFLEPVAPFRLDLTAWTLRRRPDNVVDRWDGTTYRRVLALPTGPVAIAITQVATAKSPRLQIAVRGQSLTGSVKASVISAVERLLGVRIDLSSFHRFARRDERLGPLMRRFYGMKPPRLESIFESLLNGIACQQITLTLGIRLLNNLAMRYGVSLEDGDNTVHAMPRPEELAGLDPENFRQLGFSRQKGRAMIELSRSIIDGRLNLEELSELPSDAAVERLRGLRGVGRWTAEYVLLRGLGRTNIFPGDDVGARNNLQRWLGLPQPPGYDDIQRTLSPWAPYGGLIYFHLLLERLEAAGYFQASPQTSHSQVRQSQSKVANQLEQPTHDQD